MSKPSRLLLLFLVAGLVLAGCGPRGQVTVTPIESQGATEIRGDVWADNWFSLSLAGSPLVEDSVSITTERSFNAESFTFSADLPAQLSFVLKDFKENDTGLEYIGSGKQQMGDGGFIAEFTNVATGARLAVTDSRIRCRVIHAAPLDKTCEDAPDPKAGVAPCTFESHPEPEGWHLADFDDSGWVHAVEHSASAVRPKGGYDAIDWDADAKIVWSEDLERDNTLLCRMSLDDVGTSGG